ncbi:MAG TPA: SMC family ATPase [Longimicrobiales bacterium]|nr:SMC family ATPase [Longimicrobiales bacterium]
MRLDRLRLLNFRQHADTAIEFRSGVTGIIGPNGAGKSTLLEAIAWAIYGAGAARGTNETIRFVRAEPRSPVRVELEFGIGGHEYRVQRTMSSADVFVDGEDAPAATTIRGVTDYLQQRLGMTRDEFFNTYFTGQKELQFLAQMGPADRGRFLAQVLGYERLRLAQERARARRNDLRHEIEGLKTGMADAASLRAELELARGRREEAREAADAARLELAAATARMAEVAPRWEEAQRAQERAGELEHRREMAAQEYREAARAVARVEEELAAVSSAEKELTILRGELAPLAELVRECERLSELARLDERRRVLDETVRALLSEIAEGDRRLEALAQAPGYVERFRKELETLRGELAEVEGRLEKERDAWQQDRQEVRTRLATYKDRTAELQAQLDKLREAGPEGTCPTCDRPLHDHYDQVMRALEDEWESLVQDGKWLKKREGQLEPKPPALAEAETRRAELQATIDGRAEKLSRSEKAVEDRAALEKEQARRRERLAALAGELTAIPRGYDRIAHQAAARRLEGLRGVERKAARLEETASRKERAGKELEETARRRKEAEDRGVKLKEELDALAFDRTRFDAAKAAHEAAADGVRRGELRLADATSRLDAAEEALARAERSERELDQKKEALEALESERRHNAELDTAFNQLRVELNARVRPELSELASAFLTDITAGRYTALEIDEAYNVLVLDEGEEKPVISGGEEDIANLVLRLAISQMIAERAGHPLSVLILDEVFGSLDVERRDNVIRLLHGLTGRFEQVIVITHIEGIRDGLDNVIRCTFEERTGASRVEEEPGTLTLAELAGV